MEHKSTPTLVLPEPRAGSGCLLLLMAMGDASDLAESSEGTICPENDFLFSSQKRGHFLGVEKGVDTPHSQQPVLVPAQPSPCPQVGAEASCISATVQSWGYVRAGPRQQLGNSSLPQGQGCCVPQDIWGEEWDGTCSASP